jgi:hypothetical protein
MFKGDSSASQHASSADNTLNKKIYFPLQSTIAYQSPESNRAHHHRERNQRCQLQLQQALIPNLQVEPAQQQMNINQQQEDQPAIAQAAAAPVIRVAKMPAQYSILQPLNFAERNNITIFINGCAPLDGETYDGKY